MLSFNLLFLANNAVRNILLSLAFFHKKVFYLKISGFQFRNAEIRPRSHFKMYKNSSQQSNFLELTVFVFSEKLRCTEHFLRLSCLIMVSLRVKRFHFNVLSLLEVISYPYAKKPNFLKEEFSCTCLKPTHSTVTRVLYDLHVRTVDSLPKRFDLLCVAGVEIFAKTANNIYIAYVTSIYTSATNSNVVFKLCLPDAVFSRELTRLNAVVTD